MQNAEIMIMWEQTVWPYTGGAWMEVAVGGEMTIWQKKSLNQVDFWLFILRSSFAYPSLKVRSRYRVGKRKDGGKVFNDTVSGLTPPSVEEISKRFSYIPCQDTSLITK